MVLSTENNKEKVASPMEWGLHIRGVRDLETELSPESLCALEASPTLQPVMRQVGEVIRQTWGLIDFSRVYFGAEFCENLIPARDDLFRALHAARERNLSFTLFTPYVGNAGLGRLRPLFAALQEAGTHEVVFSDWGVLHLLRGEYPRLIPVQGRLLNKSLRDPRIAGAYAALGPTPGPSPARDAVQRSNLDNATYLRLLQSLGVQTVELDGLLQGTDLSAVDLGMALSVSVPFGVVTTGRACMAAGLGYAKAEKFQPAAPCRCECQSFQAQCTYSASPFGNQDQKFHLKGNTYFYVHPEHVLRTALEQARNGAIARLVLQPRLPMVVSPGAGREEMLAVSEVAS